ncbi:hypothetical protein BT93_F2153 [Corymbia citriodora subsp. variegata]|nr:hypothetical protein BT93_F2153 [Corymbia citriodora subsp. variegata]
MADIRERASKAAPSSNRHSLTPPPLMIPSFCSFHSLHIISLFLWVYARERERLCFFWGCFVLLSIHAQSSSGYISRGFLVGVCASIIPDEVTYSSGCGFSLPIQGLGFYRLTQNFDRKGRNIELMKV